MWWEQECEAVNESDTVEIEGQTVNKLAWLCFTLNKSLRAIEISQNGSPLLPQIFTGNKPEPPTEQNVYDEYTYDSGGYRFHYKDYGVGGGGGGTRLHEWIITRLSDNTILWYYQIPNQHQIQTLPYEITLQPVSGSGATGTVTLYVHDINVYSRYICDTEKVAGVNTYPIPSDDIVENNRNYRRMIGYYFPDTIFFSTSLTSTPNQWGLYQPGQYYQPPYLYWNPELFPIARNGWGRVSIWFTFYAFDWIVEKSGRQPFTIRHAYPLASVLSVLLAKIAPGITHAATTDYSQFLYGTNLIGINQTLLITPKSNIVSAGYDQPAQKAPITLKNVLDMLRDCFRCYWFIDSNNRFRVEHIEYFRRGGSYSSNPVVGIDLTQQRVPRNGKAWAFARDQYKFDKPEMAARYQFGWMDDVTQLFEGYPIDIISKYVNPDNIEQIDISKFTSDIDYILLNPGEISKDGFVLLGGKIYVRVCDDTNFDGVIWGGTTVVASNANYDGFVLKVNPNCEYPVVFNGSITSIAAFSSVPTIGIGDNYIGYLNISGGKITTGPGAQYLLITVKKDSFTYLRFTDNYTMELPYMNFNMGGDDHYLQNYLVAFIYLQNYYAYDMPASLYSINGEQMYAQGVKKLKTQSLKFPLLTDPDVLKLVKTNLGNGMIQKLSVNLSSRNANATLKYDTE